MIPKPVDAGTPYRVQVQHEGQWLDLGPWLKGRVALDGAIRGLLSRQYVRVLRGIGDGVWTVETSW